MPLSPYNQLHKSRSPREWGYLNDSNNICPGCKKQIYNYDTDIEYSKTKRDTHIFWHTGCTTKVWH